MTDKPKPRDPYRFEPANTIACVGDWVFDPYERGLMQVVALFPEKNPAAIWTAVATDWEFEAKVVSQWGDGSGWRILRRRIKEPK